MRPHKRRFASLQRRKNWDSAMRIVERELRRAPQDHGRARVARPRHDWSGQLAEAEKEYLGILKVYAVGSG